MIVPFAPGAATDIEGRIYATKLSEALGQSFVLDFKPGGSMTIGMNQAVRQKPDGHLTGLWLQSSTGTKYTFVHYKAAGASYPDLMVGRAHATPMTLQTSLPRVKAGKVKAIGVASPQRNALLPDLPTFHEQGVTDFEYSTWMGLLAPEKTPAAIVNKLQAELARIIRHPDVLEKSWARRLH